jgi:hypothetical protein
MEKRKRRAGGHLAETCATGAQLTLMMTPLSASIGTAAFHKIKIRRFFLPTPLPLASATRPSSRGGQDRGTPD